MAGDWIKMRTSLLTNPKVNGIARALEDDPKVSKALTTGFNGRMSEVVTRDVMRHVTVSSLLVVWGAANEHTSDGVFAHADTSDVDDMVGIPGFGAAMESVGWLFVDEENGSISLPNFNEYNTSGASRSAGAKTSAQRQKEYRDRKKACDSDVTRDVTSDVTSNRREEKRREENKSPPTPSPGEWFDRFWSEYPNCGRKAAKAQCARKWAGRGLDSLGPSIVAHVAAMKSSEAWRKESGAYIPAPLVYLNQARWEAPVGDGDAVAWHETRSGIEARGEELGVGRWDEYAASVGQGEPFSVYQARVFAAAGYRPQGGLQ